MPTRKGAKIMSKLRSLLAVAVILGAWAAAPRADPPPADRSEADIDLLLDTIRANRKALVAVNLELSADEASRFWPLYDRYLQELQATGDRLARVIQEYTASFPDLSNETAMKLMDEYLAIEADRVKLRRAYLGEFAKGLPGRTVARLYQIENKLDAVIRYDLAASIPVVEEEASPSK
jgi:hypothetical protein